MKRTFASLFLIAAAAIACNSKPETETKAEAPLLVSTTPAAGAQDVSSDKADIVFTFDQNIKYSTANQKNVTVSGDAVVSKVNAYNKNLTVSLDGLQPKTEYTVTVPAGTVLGFKPNQEGAAAATLTFKTKEGVAPVLPPEPDKIPEPEDNDAWNQAAKIGLGWNMGNHFDAFYNGSWAGDKFLWPDETCWGNPKCTKNTFTGLYAAGFRSVRIPITWLNTINFETYEIDKTWMNRIKEVVGWARDAGLQVIINTHHDEDHYYGNESMGHRWLNIIDATTDSGINERVKKDIRGFWTTVANEFKGEGDYLIFESFNEINDGKWGGSSNTNKQAAVLNEWNQVFVDAVRATGGNNETRWLGVPTYAANPSLIKWFAMPEDPAGRTMLAVHCYDPYNFTLAEGLPQKKWGHTAGNSNDEKLVREVFASLYTNFIAKGIPVYMGEFGCSMRTYNSAEWKCQKYYLEYFVKCSKSYGLPCFLWDNGNKGAGSEHHAYIDHGTGSFIDNSKELVDVMVKAMYNKDKNYTLDSVYDNAPAM